MALYKVEVTAKDKSVTGWVCVKECDDEQDAQDYTYRQWRDHYKQYISVRIPPPAGCDFDVELAGAGQSEGCQSL